MKSLPALVMLVSVTAVFITSHFTAEKISFFYDPYTAGISGLDRGRMKRSASVRHAVLKPVEIPVSDYGKTAFEKIKATGGGRVIITSHLFSMLYLYPEFRDALAGRRCYLYGPLFDYGSGASGYDFFHETRFSAPHGGNESGIPVDLFEGTDRLVFYSDRAAVENLAATEPENTFFTGITGVFREANPDGQVIVRIIDEDANGIRVFPEDGEGKVPDLLSVICIRKLESGIREKILSYRGRLLLLDYVNTANLAHPPGTVPGSQTSLLRFDYLLSFARILEDSVKTPGNGVFYYPVYTVATIGQKK